MPGVQQVEAATGRHHRAAGRPYPRHHLRRPRSPRSGRPPAGDPGCTTVCAGGGDATATPPAATYCDASSTARSTASETSAPAARASAAATPNRSPAPQVSPSALTGGRHHQREWSRRGRAARRHRPASPPPPRPASAAAAPGRCGPPLPAGSRPAGLGQVPRLRLVRGGQVHAVDGGRTRGCGSQTTGAGVAASAARSAGCRGDPATVVADQDRRRRGDQLQDRLAGSPGGPAGPPRSCRSSTRPGRAAGSSPGSLPGSGSA